MATQKISEMTEAIILQDEDYVPIVQSELNKKIKIEYLRDYNKLHNKPTLNGVTIENNKKLSDYNVVKANQGIKVNSSTKQTLELEVPTKQELEQRSDVNKAITIATADKMAKETAHQTMSKGYAPNSQPLLTQGENQPVSYKAVKDYVDILETKVDTNESDIESKVSALGTEIDTLETKVDTNETDIENKFNTLQQTVNNNKTELGQDIENLNSKITKNQEDIANLQEQTSNIDDNILTIEEDISLLKEKDEELVQNMNSGYTIANGNSYSGPSSDYGIEIGKVSGNYEQVTTNGYQLFDQSKLPTKSQGGVTVTNNGDGSFTVSGSGQISESFSLKYTYTHEETVNLIKSGNLKLSGDIPVTNPILQIYLQTDSGAKNTLSNSSAGSKSTTVLQETLEDESCVLVIQFYTGINKAITVGTIKPMLYQDGDGTWERFTGGEPAPNPNYPLEPKFFEPKHVNTNGGNLFDASKLQTKSQGGVTVTNNGDGSFTVSGNGNITTGNYDLRMDLTHEETIKLLKAGTLKCNFEIVSEPYFYILIANKNGFIKEINGIKTGLKTIDITQEYLNDDSFYLRYGFYGILNKPIKSGTIKPMVYQDGDGTWLPYNVDSTPLSLMLRALPNGVCDTYENGVITRKVGYIEFDGSSDESWDLYNENKIFVINLPLLKPSPIDNHVGDLICDKFVNIPYINAYNGLQQGIGAQRTPTIGIHIDEDSVNTLESWKTWLQSNPIKVWYELAEPYTEQVDLPIIPSYFPYTNAWHDSEVEANDLTWFINTYARNSEYTDEFLQKFFALQRTGKVYTVRFPLFSKSTSPIGEKMDHNEGLTCNPSTDTIIGQDDYQDIPLFKTYDVNAYSDDNGRIHVTAFKGDKYFKDTGKVDVFVLGMSYYEKYWEDDNYWYYSRTDMPRDGYTLCAECRNTDGSESSYALYSKYISGEIDGKPYSSKGLIPKRNISYNACESYYHSRGKNYGGSPMYLYKYLMTTFYLKYATLNTQSKIYGCFNYSYQYAASMAENNVKRIVLTTAQAANIVVGSYVSIGDKGSNSSVDRSNSYMHNKAEEVEVISKTTVDDSRVAINVDSPTSFNTTTTTYLSTMHWKSGFSDNVLGRDGSIGDLTSGKYPMVLQGIELAVGGYEVAGNAFMDIVSSTGKRDIYVTNDNSKITTTVADAKSMYNKSKNSSQPTTLSAWNYITKMALDEENGMFNVIECGNSGSGSATGFCDGFYVDSGASGQREFLLLGNLWNTAICGLSCVNANSSLSLAYWTFLARLSISGRKG